MTHKKYPSLLNDLAFKVVFGSEHSTDILKDFVNAVLKDSGQAPVEEISIMNPFNLAQYVGDKESIIDIKAKDAQGRRFVIEVQLLYHEHFSERIVYYGHRVGADQLDRGQQYDRIRPTISINIVDFAIPDPSQPRDRVHKTYMMREETPGTPPLTDSLVAHFLDIGALKNLSRDVILSTPADYWLYFIAHAGEEDSDPLREEILTQHKPIHKAAVRYEQVLSDAEVREMIEGQEKARMIREDQINGALKQGLREGEANGLAKGLDKGRAEGSHDAQLQIARNLLARGFDLETISELTELPLTEIQALKE